MNDVYTYIDAHASEYIELLQKLCRQPSVSAQNYGMREMAELLNQELKKTGVNTTVYETGGNPILYGELDGENKNRTISFYNHYDVQPVEPLDAWISGPFDAEIRNGRLYARGASDNKGSLLSRLCALKAILAVRGKAPLNVKFIYEGEEEIGSLHLRQFAKEHPECIKTDGFAWEGGSKKINTPDEIGPLEVCLGVKGLLYVELRCKKINSDIHSQNAAIVKNPMWRIVQALATMKDVDENITIDGFYDNVREPTAYEMECLETLKYNEARTKARLGIDGFVNDLTGIPLLRRYHYEPVANISGAKAGYIGEGAKTIMPGTAVVKMDFRLVPNQMPDEILEKIRLHLDRRGFQDIEVVKISSDAPFRADPNCLFAQTVIRCAKKVYGVQPEVFISHAGSTAMYQFCHESNLDAVMFGAGSEDENIHAPNENIILDNFIDAIKMAATVMDEFAKA